MPRQRRVRRGGDEHADKVRITQIESNTWVQRVCDSLSSAADTLAAEELAHKAARHPLELWALVYDQLHAPSDRRRFALVCRGFAAMFYSRCTHLRVPLHEVLPTVDTFFEMPRLKRVVVSATDHLYTAWDRFCRFWAVRVTTDPVLVFDHFR